MMDYNDEILSYTNLDDCLAEFSEHINFYLPLIDIFNPELVYSLTTALKTADENLLDEILSDNDVLELIEGTEKFEAIFENTVKKIQEDHKLAVTSLSKGALIVYTSQIIAINDNIAQIRAFIGLVDSLRYILKHNENQLLLDKVDEDLEDNPFTDFIEGIDF